MKTVLRLAAMAGLGMLVAGCGGGADLSEIRTETHLAGRHGDMSLPEGGMECVPFARARSGLAIYGDAYTWWDQAGNRYARASRPDTGAVMVLYNYAGPTRGHLAVVRGIDSSRVIRVDHANWLNDGAVYLDDPVRDVSPDNDWSTVQVWNVRTQAWGTRIYPVRGFIGAEPAGDEPLILADRR